MKRITKRILLVVTVSFCVLTSFASKAPPRFKAVVLSENGGHHVSYSTEAKRWLNRLAADSNFVVDYISNTDSISDAYLRQYGLFIQLDYPPYGWKEKAVVAFKHYIEAGLGGWIGFHHASLLGDFDGYPMWQWFSGFMGGIRFKNYIPGFADGTVRIEDTLHPVVKNLSRQFTIRSEEWYTYDKSPRSRVRVIASVNESSYNPPSSTTMGDHPVVWTNLAYRAKNIYIFMGHSPSLFANDAYTDLFRNSIFWAAGQ